MISVIIPTYQEVSRLKMCLTSISNQTNDKNLEVIVVDNEKEPNSRVESLVRMFGYLYLHQPVPGSYSARNKGLEYCNNKHIVFTDSDCIFDENYFELLIDLISRTDFNVIAGNVRLFSEDSNRPNMAEKFDLMTAFPQKRYVEKFNFGVTANLIVNKDIFSKVGLFNSQLMSGGDYEFGQRLRSNNITISYYRDLKVYHPCRSSFIDIKSKIKRTTIGHQSRLRFRNIFPSLFQLSTIWSRKKRGVLMTFQSIIISVYLHYYSLYFKLIGNSKK